MANTARKRHNGFRRMAGGVFTCASCGKRTRSTGDNQTVCPKCYEEGGFENEHSDNDGVHYGYGKNEAGYTDPTSWGKAPDKCPTCREELEETERVDPNTAAWEHLIETEGK